MNLIGNIVKQLASDIPLVITRAEQVGEPPVLPYATFKIIGDGKGSGHENLSYEDKQDDLIERITEERMRNVTFTVYAATHTASYQYAQVVRKWFARNDTFLSEHGAAVAKLSDVINKSVYLVDAYEEKYGVDVTLRYESIDTDVIDYFDKVEYKILIDRE